MAAIAYKFLEGIKKPYLIDFYMAPTSFLLITVILPTLL
jgi:hypothetical protein